MDEQAKIIVSHAFEIGMTSDLGTYFGMTTLTSRVTIKSTYSYLFEKIDIEGYLDGRLSTYFWQVGLLL